MGQAKQRGTFEQRKAEGEAKRKAERAAAEEREAQARAERAKRLAARTPEQRAKDRMVNQILLMGVASLSRIPRGLWRI